VRVCKPVKSVNTCTAGPLQACKSSLLLSKPDLSSCDTWISGPVCCYCSRTEHCLGKVTLYAWCAMGVASWFNTHTHTHARTHARTHAHTHTHTSHTCTCLPGSTIKHKTTQQRCIPSATGSSVCCQQKGRGSGVVLCSLTTLCCLAPTATSPNQMGCLRSASLSWRPSKLCNCTDTSDPAV